MLRANWQEIHNAEWSIVGKIDPADAEHRAVLLLQFYPALDEYANQIKRGWKIAATFGACKRGDYPGVFLVHKDGNKFHTVDMIHRTCSCTNDEPAVCEHRVAIALHVFGSDLHTANQMGITPESLYTSLYRQTQLQDW